MTTEALIAKKVDGLLKKKQDRTLQEVLVSLDAHMAANVIDLLPRGKRKSFGLLPPEMKAEVALQLSDHTLEYLLPRLPDETFARFLHFVNEDDATDLLQFLGEVHRLRVLNLLKPDKRYKIERLLTYGSETAGGLMDLNFITVPADAAVKNVLDTLHSHTPKQGQAPIVIICNNDDQAVGYLPHKSLLFAPHTRLAKHLMRSVSTANPNMDREHVVELIMKHKSSLVCVTNEQNSPIGIIHLSDLLVVSQEEATEDLYLFAGVDAEENMHDGVFTKVRRRYFWLLVNLLTAFLAALVVAQFQNTIAKFALLAAYMPLVAGEGGNAATQALVVVIRGLTIGEVSWSTARTIIIREALAGMCNGLLVGVVAAGVAAFFGASPLFGLVLGVAMVINLFIAGVFGSLIPFVLKTLKVDPAVASSVFVTTATDIFGFFVFLGLASVILF